jgi:hypothetical protein
MSHLIDIITLFYDLLIASINFTSILLFYVFIILFVEVFVTSFYLSEIFIQVDASFFVSGPNFIA